MFHETVTQALLNALELRDKDSAGHSYRTAMLALELGRVLGLTDQDMDRLRTGTLLHDVGKIGIPDHILLKPGPLDVAERNIMQTHARIGYDLLKGGQSELLRMGAEISLTHHEKYNGEGYPNGFAAETIPLSGRVVATADVFDALVNRRHYKQAWPLDDAIDYMRNESGRHFDPGCVAALLRRIHEVVDIQKKFSEDHESVSKNPPAASAFTPKSASA